MKVEELLGKTLDDNKPSDALKPDRLAGVLDDVMYGDSPLEAIGDDFINLLAAVTVTQGAQSATILVVAYMMGALDYEKEQE